jgi:hypothetical protein
MHFVPQSLYSLAQLDAELCQIATPSFVELHPPEVVPDTPIRVQIGCVVGQAFQMDWLSSTTGQQALGDLTAVDRRAIGDDQRIAWVLSESCRVKPELDTGLRKDLG